MERTPILVGLFSARAAGPILASDPRMGFWRALFLVVLLPGARPASAQEAATPEATFQQGVEALKAGRLGEAEAAFRRVLKLGGHEAYVHNNLAIVYQQQDRHREAVAECREAIRLDPAYAAPRLVLGGSLLALGRVAEATAALEAAVKLLPKERLARAQLARAYDRAGRPAEAVEQYRTLRDMAPGDPEAAYELGRAYLRLSQWAMERLRDIDPRSARIYQALGHNYRVQGRTDLAVRAFELAARKDPRLPEIHLALAQLHFAEKNWAAARAELEKELALVPESAGALALKQRLDAEEGR
jgi:Flp pilus assembly protein TadD